MLVITKAIGHAMMNCFIQVANHSADGPSAIKDMMPDIDSAIRQVMKIWVTIMVRLSIVWAFFWMDSAAG